MESLWLLVPLSVVLVFALVALFAWSLNSGQFEDIEEAGRRVLEEDDDLPGAGGAVGEASPAEASGAPARAPDGNGAGAAGRNPEPSSGPGANRRV